MGRGTGDLMEVTLLLTFSEEFKQCLGPRTQTPTQLPGRRLPVAVCGYAANHPPDGPAGGVGAPSTGIFPSVFLTKLRPQTCQIRSPFSPLRSSGCLAAERI